MRYFIKKKKLDLPLIGFLRLRFFRDLYSVFRHLLLLIFLWVIIHCLSPSPVEAGVGNDVRIGNKLYGQEEFQNAYEKYQEALEKNRESDMINFNAGAASYKMKEYEQAADYFQKALLAEDPELRRKAHYNSGNTFYRLGEEVGPQNPQEALPFLEKSLMQYEQALKLNNEDVDTKYNFEFVKKVIEKVKEQIEQQKQQCQNSQDNSQEPKDAESQENNQQQNMNQEQSQQGDNLQENSQQDQSDQDRDDEYEQQKQNDGMQPEQGSNQQAGKQSSTGEEQKDLDKMQAQIRLKDYENNEAPKEMLNLRGTFDARPVLKDW